MFSSSLVSSEVTMINSNATSKFPQQHSDDGLKTLSKLLPIAIAIVLANGLVFALFYRCRLLRTSSNYVLLSLAVCDFSTGAIAIPYLIVCSFAILPKELNYGIYYLHTSLAVSGAYHILVITALKYLATVRPLKHHVVTKGLVLKILFGIWIMSTVFAVIPLVWQGAEVSQRRRWRSIYNSVCLVTVFLLPYIYIIHVFLAMFRTISNRQRSSLVQKKNIPQNKKKSQSDRKCILVFAAMAIIFTCSWLPYFTIKLLLGMGIQVLLNVMEAVVIIRYITSFAKPLLYTFFKRDFLSSLRNLLQNRENVSLSAQKNSNTLLNSLVDYGQDQVSTTASWHHLKAKDKDQELIAKKT